VRSLLSLFDDDSRRLVLSRARRRRFKRGEVVFHDGDPGDTLHVIVKGHFAVRITTPLGDVATVRVLGPDDHFGELSVLSDAPRTGSVSALDAAETLGLHRDDLAVLRGSVAAIDAVLTETLVAEVQRLSSVLVDALYVPADRRIWRRLAELVEIYADGGETVVIPLTQDDVAQLAGTTRPTVNRVLRGAEDDGVIVLSRGKIEVLEVDQVARRGR
jgi:CRP/FNR family transcriptional regulator, cyclic AMP receptor protein